MGYYAWRAWRLSGGLPSRRPPGLPTRVPARWWLRLSLYRLRHPAVSAPRLGSIGWGLTAVFDNPAGGVEDVDMQWNSGGLRTWFLNVRQIGWDAMRAKLGTRGTVIPWQRCYAQDDVEHLKSVAGQWGSAAIGINYEPGADTALTIQQIAESVKDYPGFVYIMVSPWMENDEPWRLIAHRAVFIIEGFTNERPYDIDQLVEHAHKLGALQVAVMAGVYPAALPPPRSLAEWRQHWAGVPILYLGDNLGADPAQWTAWNPIAPEEV